MCPIGHNFVKNYFLFKLVSNLKDLFKIIKASFDIQVFIYKKITFKIVISVKDVFNFWT